MSSRVVVDDDAEGRPLIGLCVRCHRWDDLTLEDEWVWYDLPLCPQCEDAAFHELPWQFARTG